MSNPRDSYDGLAAGYHRMFADRDAVIGWQAGIFDALIGDGGQTILDCACGIGTRALRTRPDRTPLQVSTAGGFRSVTLQLWHWHWHWHWHDGGRRYDFEHFQLHQGDSGWHTEHRTLWALTRAEITAFAAVAGFSGTAWRSTADTGYYQPILAAWWPVAGIDG